MGQDSFIRVPPDSLGKAVRTISRVVSGATQQVHTYVKEGLVSQFVQYSAATAYYGETMPGISTAAASWRIRRIIASGTTNNTSWAATGRFTQIWDNRYSLTFSP